MNTQAYRDGRRPDETRVIASNFQRFEIILIQTSSLTKESVQIFILKNIDAFNQTSAEESVGITASIQVVALAGDEDSEEEETS